MDNDNFYSKLNNALISAGMDPAKAMQHPTSSNEFHRLCQEVGARPSAICEAAGV